MLFIFGLPKIICSSQYSMKAETSSRCNLLPIKTFPMVLLALTMKSMGEESGQNQNKNLTRHILHKMSRRLVRKTQQGTTHVESVYHPFPPQAEADRRKQKTPWNARKQNKPSLLFTAKPRIKEAKAQHDCNRYQGERFKTFFRKGLRFWQISWWSVSKTPIPVLRKLILKSRSDLERPQLTCCQAEGCFTQQI